MGLLFKEYATVGTACLDAVVPLVKSTHYYRQACETGRIKNTNMPKKFGYHKWLKPIFKLTQVNQRADVRVNVNDVQSDSLHTAERFR